MHRDDAHLFDILEAAEPAFSTIANVNSTIGRKRIQYWLEQYGKLVETADMWERTKLPLDGKT